MSCTTRISSATAGISPQNYTLELQLDQVLLLKNSRWKLLNLSSKSLTFTNIFQKIFKNSQKTQFLGKSTTTLCRRKIFPKKPGQQKSMEKWFGKISLKVILLTHAFFDTSKKTEGKKKLKQIFEKLKQIIKKLNNLPTKNWLFAQKSPEVDIFCTKVCPNLSFKAWNWENSRNF